MLSPRRSPWLQLVSFEIPQLILMLISVGALLAGLVEILCSLALLHQSCNSTSKEKKDHFNPDQDTKPAYRVAPQTTCQHNRGEAWGPSSQQRSGCQENGNSTRTPAHPALGLQGILGWVSFLAPLGINNWLGHRETERYHFTAQWLNCSPGMWRDMSKQERTVLPWICAFRRAG